MKINVKNPEFVKFMQEGGAVPEETPVASAPAESAQGGSPEELIIAACQQALETQDCNLAMQVLLAIMQMVGGSQLPTTEAPGQPVYRKGGILKYWKK